MKIALWIIPVVWLSGCVSPYTRPDPMYAATRPAEPAAMAGVSGAIYQDATALRLYEDIKPRRVGDMLTIVLVENTNATKEATTATKKENDIALENPVLFGSAVQFNIAGNNNPARRLVPLQNTTGNTLDVTANSAQEFSGSGSSKQSNSLKGAITVTVSEVLPNGNLVVRGEKIVAINEGDEFVRVSGIVRPQDIRPDNSVYSTKVADARISYGGSGTVADANSHGWMSRFFMKWWPF